MTHLWSPWPPLFSTSLIRSAAWLCPHGPRLTSKPTTCPEAPKDLYCLRSTLWAAARMTWQSGSSHIQEMPLAARGGRAGLWGAVRWGCPPWAGPRGQTHYWAQSMSWYSLDRSKQAFTPSSSQSFFTWSKNSWNLKKLWVRKHVPPTFYKLNGKRKCQNHLQGRSALHRVEGLIPQSTSNTLIVPESSQSRSDKSKINDIHQLSIPLRFYRS